MKILILAIVVIIGLVYFTYPTFSYSSGKHIFTHEVNCAKCHSDKDANLSCKQCHIKGSGHAVNSSVQPSTCKACHNTLSVHHTGSHSTYTCMDCHVSLHGNIRIVRDCSVCHGGKPYYSIDLPIPDHH